MRQLNISHRITSRETDSFKKYLKEVSDIPLLTTDEEIKLTKLAAEGDEVAIEKLINANLRFVISVAKQYVNAGTPIEDLVNEGNIGLMIGVRKFDPSRGFKFISYAVSWIRKTILEYLAKNGRIVRLPANKINGLSKLNKKISMLEQKLCRQADISEIICEFGDSMTQEEITLLEAISVFSVSSLDVEVQKDTTPYANGVTLADMIADESCLPTDHLIVEQNLKKEIATILNSLKPKEKRIIVALYGLDGQQPMRLHDIGAEMGVTRESIRQVKMKTLKKLEARLKDSSINLN